MIRLFDVRSLVGRAVVFATFLLMFALTSFGLTLEQYKTKTDAAFELASTVEALLDTEESDALESKRFVEYIRAEFQPAEKIEWYGGTADASHEWLLRRTNDLEKETRADERLTIAREIREYLSTIAFKLRELEQPQAALRTKDEDKQKLAEILRREEYQKPETSQESVFTRWFRELLEWLESIFPKPKAPTSSGSGMEVLAFFLQILFYVGLVALLILLIVKVAPLLFPKLKTQRKPKKKSRVILGEQIDDNQSASDLFDEAERLARQGDLRGAIRKGYIALLCDLADRKVIGLSRHKTNRDYLRDVRARRELHPRMKSVTDTFERNWYGSQESGEQDWTRFRNEYNDAIRSV